MKLIRDWIYGQIQRRRKVARWLRNDLLKIKSQPSENIAESEPQPEINEADSDIGISSLMNKRAKLEEAIDYVGGLISNLKEKRTNLEKEIEEESVDIKNLKEKLMKVSDYIDEETRGIQHLNSEEKFS